MREATPTYTQRDGGPSRRDFMTRMGRLRSLDVFRGLTVAAMVLVNSPGGDDVFAPLRHALWNGCTPTDLIFPAFLVILGVSAVFSDAARKARGIACTATARKVLLRFGVLIGLGLIENAFLYYGTAGIRFPGVLQRIALCYLGVSAFLLLDRPKAEAAAAAGMLLVYWFVMTFVPVPGHGAGVLTPEGNLSYWIDRRLFSGHLLNSAWGDPEGLLTTLPALATALLGLTAGRLLLTEGLPAARRIGAGGLALAALGAAWSLLFPMNKHLWTSSYALFTGGLALAGLAACLITLEGRTAGWADPFAALGRRALAVYLLAGTAYGALDFLSLKDPFVAAVFGSWLPPRAASLAFALTLTGAATAAAWALARADVRAGDAAP